MFLYLALVGGEEILNYSPYGVTWNKASSSCGINGLETVEEVLRRSDALENQQFWIGKTSIFTPWIELIEFLGTVFDSDDPGNCMTFCCGGCTKGSTQLHMFEARNCNAKDLTTVARCEDRTSSYWGATQNEGAMFCESKQQLLLPSTFCHQTGSSKFSGIPAWTNVIREHIAQCFETKSSKTDHVLFTTISSSGMTPKQIIEIQGNTKTTLVKRAIIGGSVGLNLLCFGIILLVRKLRKTYLFKDTSQYADLKIENRNTCNNDIYFTVID
ncbi:unnamed protein product [Mytilus edulis]|uniref:Uncharacterized protein n=1 Tax=Mytilus edulis TaxID=6550 RepID=A0A8S3RKA4_MYTED|nr:unnamed protein product [Mytilus edulis]